MAVLWQYYKTVTRFSMNSKTEELLAIAQQFELGSKDAESIIIADILRFLSAQPFTQLLGMHDSLKNREDRLHEICNIRIDKILSDLPEDKKIAVAQALRQPF